MDSQSSTSVRTYLSTPERIDPANVLTIADLEISSSLASGLVEWDSARQISAALAESWESVGAKTIRFRLRGGLRWSNGDRIKATEYKMSLERAKREYGTALRSLFDIVENINCPDDRTIAFHLRVPVLESGVLKKLTEPMYGLVGTASNGRIDLSRSSGPFVLVSHMSDELSLKANPHWWARTDALPTRVVIRRPPLKKLNGHFESDDWANLFMATSLISAERIAALKKAGLSTWERSYDKLFFIAPCARFLKEFGPDAFKSLSMNIDVDRLMAGLTGYSRARQIFPRGYALFNSEFDDRGASPQPKRIGRPLEVLMMDTDSGDTIKEHLIKEIASATGAQVDVTTVKPNAIGSMRMNEKFDFLAASLAVADPNYEGAVTFFFTADPPIFLSGEPPHDFAAQIAKARSIANEIEKGQRFKEIVSLAVTSGYVQPLFHFSSMTFAKPGLDLAHVPPSDEIVAFSKIRIANRSRK